MFADLRQKVGQGIAHARKKPKDYAPMKSDQMVCKLDNSQLITPTGTLIDLADEHELTSNGPAVLQMSDLGPIHSTPDQHGHIRSVASDRVARSRTSSINSQASGDAAFHSALGAATSHAVRQYALPSDVDSSVGGDDDSCASTVYMSPDRLVVVSKEELFKKYQRMLDRSHRYKTQFSQVIKAHRDSENERAKLKHMLEQSQDDFIEYKEQVKEQFRSEQRSHDLAIEEKDQIISSLRTQNTLLKQCGEDVSNGNRFIVDEPPNGASDGSSDMQLLDKMSRMSGLLESCKNQLSSSVEHIARVETERETLRQMLEKGILQRQLSDQSLLYSVGSLQRETEIKAAINRAQQLQELLNRYSNMCHKHRDQYVYGLDHSTCTDEKRLKRPCLDSSVNMSSKDCIICECERLRNIELKFINVVAENEKLRRSNGLGLCESMASKVGEIQAMTEADMPVATTLIISLEERLRALESELTTKALRNDDLTDVVEDLRKNIEQRDETLYQLEQQNAELAKEMYSYNDKLKYEHNRTLQTENELSRANERVDVLKDELQRVTENAEKIAANYMQHHTEAKSRFKEFKRRCSTLEETETSLRQETSRLNELLDKERKEGEEFKRTLRQHLDEKQQFVLESIKSVQIKYENKMKESQSSYEATLGEMAAQNEHETDQLKALKDLETEIMRGQMELQFQKQVEALKEQVQHERESALSEVRVRSSTNISLAKEELKKQFAIREAELICLVEEARQQSTTLKSVIDTLSNAKSESDALLSAEASSLKEQILLNLEEHETVVIELSEKNTLLQKTVYDLQSKMDCMRSQSDLVVTELSEQHAEELKTIHQFHENKRSAENRKWSNIVGNFLKEITRLRDEISSSMTTIISVHHNDVRDIEAQVFQLVQLHNNAVGQIAQHLKEIKSKDHALECLQDQCLKDSTDAARQMASLSDARQDDAAVHADEVQRLHDVHEISLTNLSNEHEKAMSSLKSELCNVLEENKQLRSQLEQVNTELSIVLVDRDRLAVELRGIQQQGSLLELSIAERAELQQTIASKEHKIKKLLRKLEDMKHENEMQVGIEAERHAKEVASLLLNADEQTKTAEKHREEICRLNQEIETLQMRISEFEVSVIQASDEKNALHACLMTERSQAVLLHSALSEKDHLNTELRHRLDETHLIGYENQTLKDRLNSLDCHWSAQLQCEKDTHAKLEKVVHGERQRSSELLRDVDELKKQQVVSDDALRNLQIEKQSLEERLTAMIDDIAILEHAAKVTEEEKAQLSNQVLCLKSSYDDLEKEKQFLVDSLNELRLKLSCAESQMHTIDVDRSSFEAKWHESVDANVKFKRQLQDSSDMNCDLLDQIKGLMEQRELLETRLIALKNDNESLENLLKDYEIKSESHDCQKQSLEVELRETLICLNQTRQDIAQSKLSCEQLSNELNASLECNTTLEDELEDLKKSNVLIAEKLQEIQTNNSLQEREKTFLEEENESLQKQLLNTQEIAQRQENELQYLRENTQVLGVAVDVSKETVDQLNARVQQLLDEVTSLRLCMKDLEDDVETRHQSQLKLEQQLLVSADDLQNAKLIISSLQDENGILNGRVVENTSQLEQLLSKIAQLECEKETLNTSLATSRNESQKYLDELDQTKRAYSTLLEEMEVIKSDLSNAKSELEESNSKILQQESDKINLEQTLRSSQEICGSLTALTDQNDTQLGEVVRKLEDSRFKVTQLESDKEKLDMELSESQQLCESLAASREQLQNELHQACSQNMNENIELNRIRSERDDSKLIMQQLVSDKERLERKLREYDEVCSSLSVVKEQLQKDFDVLHISNLALQEDISNAEVLLNKSESELKIELEGLRATIVQLESEKSSLECELDACRKVCSSIIVIESQHQADQVALQHLNTTLREENDTFKAELGETLDRLEGLKLRVQYLETTKESLEQEVERSRELCESLTVSRDQYQNDYDGLQQINTALNDEKNSVVSEVTTMKCELADCHSTILRLESDNKRLGVELKESSELCQSVVATREQLQRDMDGWQPKLLSVETLQDELSHVNKELSATKDELEALHNSLSALNCCFINETDDMSDAKLLDLTLRDANIHEVGTLLGDLHSKVERLESSRRMFELELRESRDVCTAVTASRDQFQKDCVELEQEKSKLQVELEHVNNELSKLTSESDSLKLQIQQFESEKRSLEQEFCECENLCASVTESMDQCEKHNIELQETVSRLQNENHAVSDQLSNLKKELEDCHSSSLDLKSCKERLELELHDSRGLCNSLAVLRDHSQKDYDTLHEKCMKLKSDRIRLNVELQKSQDKYNELTAVLTDKFQKDLEQLKSAHEEVRVNVDLELDRAKSQLNDCHSKILALESDNNRLMLDAQEVHNSFRAVTESSQKDLDEHRVKLDEQIDSAKKELFATQKELQASTDLTEKLQFQIVEFDKQKQSLRADCQLSESKLIVAVEKNGLLEDRMNVCSRQLIELTDVKKCLEQQLEECRMLNDNVIRSLNEEKAKGDSMECSLNLCQEQLLKLSEENEALHKQNKLLICDLSNVKKDLSLLHEYESLFVRLVQAFNDYISSRSLANEGRDYSSASSGAETESDPTKVATVSKPSEEDHMSVGDSSESTEFTESGGSLCIAITETIRHYRHKIVDFKKQTTNIEYMLGVSLVTWRGLLSAVQTSFDLIGVYLEHRHAAVTDLVKTSATSNLKASETGDLSSSVMKSLFNISSNNSAFSIDVRQSVGQNVSILENHVEIWQKIISELSQCIEERNAVILLKDQRISEMEEIKLSKTKEIQRKCLVKLKGLQAEHQSKVDKLTNEISSANETKLAAETALSELMMAREKLEQECGELHKHVNEKNSIVEEQLRLLNALAGNGDCCEIELASTSVSDNRFLKPLNALHSLIQNIQSSLSEARAKIDELNSQLATSEQLRIESVTRIELKTNDQVNDLKRRAKVKLAQIVHQLQTDKESSVREMKDVLDELRARVIVAEDERADANKLAHDIEQRAAEASAGALNEIAELRRAIEEKEASLQRVDSERVELARKLKVSERELGQIVKDRQVDVQSSELHLEQELNRMKCEYEEQLKDAENMHNDKIKQLLKEFNISIAEKERDHRNSFNEILEKQHLHEDRMKYEHKNEIRELQKEIRDRDETIEDLTQQTENQIQELELRHRSEIEKCCEEISVLESRISELEQELVRTTSKSDGLDQSDGESVTTADEVASCSTVSAKIAPNYEFVVGKVPPEIETDLRRTVVSLTKQIEELNFQHSAQLVQLENQLDAAAMHPRRTRSSPSRFPTFNAEEKADAIRQLRAVENQCQSLQKRLVQLSGDNATLKIREQQLVYQLRSMGEGASSDCLPASQSAGDQNVNTELEYLKNILFQYMIGTESQTLAKVICRVLKFSDEQTQIILDRQPSIA